MEDSKGSVHILRQQRGGGRGFANPDATAILTVFPSTSLQGEGGVEISKTPIA